MGSLQQRRYLATICGLPNPDHFQSDDKMSIPGFLKNVEVKPLTDVLPAMNMRSSLMFPRAMVAQSGNYFCHVREDVQEQTASASINITVLG